MIVIWTREMATVAIAATAMSMSMAKMMAADSHQWHTNKQTNAHKQRERETDINEMPVVNTQFTPWNTIITTKSICLPVLSLYALHLMLRNTHTLTLIFKNHFGNWKWHQLLCSFLYENFHLLNLEFNNQKLAEIAHQYNLIAAYEMHSSRTVIIWFIRSW